MGDFEYNGSPEGDWEERGDISWNEFDWQQFLLRHQKEVARFVATYDQHLDVPDRLDRIAAVMGWEREDWSVGEGFDEEDEEFSPREEAAGPGDADPYTLHRHPVFVVSAGLNLQVRYLWEAALNEFPTLFTASQAWRIGNTIALAERHGLLMIQAVDLGDFLLAVCHGKMALRALNDSLAHLDLLDARSAAEQSFAHAIRVRLFDLREVSLRVMNDCREEDRRGLPRDNE
jgi:hypothetical protein